MAELIKFIIIAVVVFIAAFGVLSTLFPQKSSAQVAWLAVVTCIAMPVAGVVVCVLLGIG